MLTQEAVKEMFEYREGKLFRRNRCRGALFKREAGTPSKASGYRMIMVNRKQYPAHRIVWLYFHGRIPEHRIDHINGDKSDNRIENLRHVTAQRCRRNIGNPKNNKSGVKGVIWEKRVRKWSPRIAVNKKQSTLGYYDSFDEAVLARLAAEQCLGWQDGDTSSPAYAHALKIGLIKPLKQTSKRRNK